MYRDTQIENGISPISPTKMRFHGDLVALNGMLVHSESHNHEQGID